MGGWEGGKEAVNCGTVGGFTFTRVTKLRRHTYRYMCCSSIFYTVRVMTVCMYVHREWLRRLIAMEMGRLTLKSLWR